MLKARVRRQQCRSPQQGTSSPARLTDPFLFRLGCVSLSVEVIHTIDILRTSWRVARSLIALEPHQTVANAKVRMEIESKGTRASQFGFQHMTHTARVHEESAGCTAPLYSCLPCKISEDTQSTAFRLISRKACNGVRNQLHAQSKEKNVASDLPTEITNEFLLAHPSDRLDVHGRLRPLVIATTVVLASLPAAQKRQLSQ